MTFEEKLNSLNPNQRLAVDSIEGPVMVIAGPGTGKTEILSLRIGNIIRETDTPPSFLFMLIYPMTFSLFWQQPLIPVLFIMQLLSMMVEHPLDTTVGTSLFLLISLVGLSYEGGGRFDSQLPQVRFGSAQRPGVITGT